jgi:uncharacterized protein YbbC (DUF1343 family)
MNRSVCLSVILAMALWQGCNLIDGAGEVATGADRLVTDQRSLLAGKRVGLVTNHTGRLSTGEYLVDTLVGSGIQVRALFGPEHGIRGDVEAGDTVADSVDAKTGIHVYSLYGSISKPTPAMLRDIDILVYDIQDVGVRFYTYISTMKLCMDAAAERGIPFVVLDRPNPLGVLVDGPIIEDSLKSFVGMLSVPVVYGLTAGELATMINARGWLEAGRKVDLTVVWMEGWTRSKRLTTAWIPPSPNIKHHATVDVYPATCFVEATNASEGRGTDAPFHLLGAPWMHKDQLASRLSAANLPGVKFAPAKFTPASSKQRGVACEGVSVTVTAADSFRPVFTGLTILSVFRELYADSLVIRPRSLGRLLGVSRVYGMIQSGMPPAEIEQTWLEETRQYEALISSYRHYPSH